MYRTRIVDRLDGVGTGRWNDLLARDRGTRCDDHVHDALHPFLRHEFLHTLEDTGCVGPGTGWQPEFLVLEDEAGALAAAVPMYRKTHSFGEYVFDWAWADAYRRHGRRYYPKLVAAVPFTPVAGPRLIAVDDNAAQAAARALLEHARSARVSSLHVLFPRGIDEPLLAAGGMMIRHGVQFQWCDPGWRDFDDFLGSLTQPKRKKIRAERRKVAQAGVTFDRLVGGQIGAEDWIFFHRCYCRTYELHRSSPYLTQEFFLRLGERMPEQLVMVIARRLGRPIAASLLVRDDRRLYGRYWGALETIDCLHFETAYYQAIEAALSLGIRVIEGGAQGEHKLARGFVPVPTRSAHWLAEPAFADAVDRFLAEEREAVGMYLDDLGEHVAYRDR